MKAVLISINPKWCELIASGKKTVEVRKTKPNLETPFKVYIYCTSSNVHECLMQNESGVKLIHCINYKTAIPCGGEIANGKVIGEFVCDKIHNIKLEEDFESGASSWECGYYAEEDCLSMEEFEAYLKKGFGYGWHISDLVIYDKPKELSEFYVWKKCNSCRDTGYESTACMYDENCKVPAVITRPPQSWCYVEAQDEK